jgi:hypothetical protein
MSNRGLIVLLVITLGLGGFFVFQKEMPGTIERKKQEKRLFDFSVEDVERIELTNAGGTYVFVKDGEGKWEIESPIRYPADGTTIGSLLADLEFGERRPALPSEGTFDAAELKGRFGLVDPRASVRLTTAKRAYSLDVGRETPRPGYYYGLARDGRSEELVILEGTLERQLVPELSAWRNRTVFGFSPGEITTLLVRQNGKETEVTQVGEEWRILRPLDSLAETARVKRYVSMAMGLQAVEFVGESGLNLEKMGLATPRALIEFKGASGGESLKIGGDVPGQTGLVYAQLSTRPTVVTVLKESVAELEDLLGKVRPRSLVPWSEAKFPDEIRISRGGQSYGLRPDKKAESGWLITFGEESRPVRREAIEEMVAALRALEAQEFLGMKDNRNPSYGFEKPSATVEIIYGEGMGVPPKLNLVFGGTRQGETYLESSEMPFVVTVAQGFLDGLPKQPWDWFDRTVGLPAPDKITSIGWKAGRKEWKVVKDDAGTWSLTPEGDVLDLPYFDQQRNLIGELQTFQWLGPVNAKDFAKPSLILAVGTAEGGATVIFGSPRADGSVPARIEGDAFAFAVDGQVFQAIALRPVADGSVKPPLRGPE